MVKISDLFDVVYGCNLELSRLEEDESGIPFVSRTSKNNGISGYVQKIDVIPNPAHTLSCAGGGSVLETFYQPTEYYSGRDLFYLKPKLELSEEIMIYYSICIRENKFKYSYGRQANRTMRDILIPSLEELPEWLKSKKREPFIPNQINSIGIQPENWKPYFIEEMFDVRRVTPPATIGELRHEFGTTPIVSSSRENNGIKDYSNHEPTVNKSCITIAHNGSVGETFYQSKPFIASVDVTVLNPKEHIKFTKNFAIFCCSLMKYEGKTKYSYARKWGLEKICSTVIKLPHKHDNIDFEFIENYIDNLTKKYV